MLELEGNPVAQYELTSSGDRGEGSVGHPYSWLLGSLDNKS